ncbi:hypothetical protein [Janthinobacterium sp.]|uniref:hypothetical protein n=1 Tax=Janthinobacterium sp. TaxID=1871054 RepID=UPI0026039EAC|nr:hypothetical protein [Janthinobacterium sp.]
MNDVDKNRAEHVLHLEATIQNMQRQLNDLKAEAKWIPHAEASIGTDGVGHFALTFAGKAHRFNFDMSKLHDDSVTDITNYLTDVAFRQMILEAFRPVLEPEVRKLHGNACAVYGPHSRGTQW